MSRKFGRAIPLQNGSRWSRGGGFLLFKQKLLKSQIGENGNSEASTQNSTKIWMGKKRENSD